MNRDLIRAGADRGELVKAQAVRPRNLAVAGGVFGVGVVIGAPAVFLLLALLVYAGLVATGSAGTSTPGAAPSATGSDRLPGRMDPASLDPEIGGELRKAQAMERSIDQAIKAADHPFEEITEEVAEIVSRMESSAKRAQLIKDALDDQARAGQDDRSIQAQIETLRPRFGQPDVRELVNDLEAQRRARVDLRESLERFKISMARLNASLTLIRTRLVEMTAAEEQTLQTELAAQAREVRERTERFARTMADSTPKGGDDIQRQLDEGAAAAAAQGRTTVPLRNRATPPPKPGPAPAQPRPAARRAEPKPKPEPEPGPRPVPLRNIARPAPAPEPPAPAKPDGPRSVPMRNRAGEKRPKPPERG